ncbi:MAG: hypothetical protein ACI8S6_000872 [Myxococcota bacterium]|jgi:hypothetical protein
MLLWLLLACGGDPQALQAEDIRYKDGTLADALDALAARPEPEPVDLDRIAAQLQSLEERISRAELDLVDLRNNGRMPAGDVIYDPRITTMDAHNLQDALDAVDKRIASLESRLGDNLGEAGPGLFQLPRDSERDSQPPPGNGQGPPNGQGGPPPGGRGGPSGGQGGPPPGGR